MFSSILDSIDRDLILLISLFVTFWNVHKRFSFQHLSKHSILNFYTFQGSFPDQQENYWLDFILMRLDAIWLADSAEVQHDSLVLNLGRCNMIGWIKFWTKLYTLNNLK